MSQIYTGSLPANPVPLEGAAFNHGPAELSRAQVMPQAQVPQSAPQFVPQAQVQTYAAQFQPQQAQVFQPQVSAPQAGAPQEPQWSQPMPQQLAPQPQITAVQQSAQVDPGEAFEVSKAQSAENLGAVATNSNERSFIPMLDSGFNRLPETREEAIAFAKYLSTSQFVPADIRSTPLVDRSADVFLMLAMGTARGMSVADCLSNIFVLFGRMGLYVRAKEGLCVKYGHWNVTLDTVHAVATAEGWRYDNGEHKIIQYTGEDARLRGLMELTDAGWIGVSKGKGSGWADKWPDMLKVRATGRLLDALFPDVIGGFVSREEIEDEQSYQSSAKKQTETASDVSTPSETASSASASSKSTASRVKSKLKKAEAKAQTQPAESAQPAPMQPTQIVPGVQIGSASSGAQVEPQNPDAMPMPTMERLQDVVQLNPNENPF